MKKVKVVFRGNKSPSGKLPNIEYLIGEKKLDNLKKDGICGGHTYKILVLKRHRFIKKIKAKKTNYNNG